MMFLSGAAFVCGASYLQRSLPLHPIEATGDIIHRNIHGAFVYGTKLEWSVLDALFYGILVFGVAAALLLRRALRVVSRKESALRGDDRF